MKRGLIAAAVAAGFLLATPLSAGAWATYCDWDPLVPIITPAGNIVLVYDSVWTASPLNLGLPLESSKTSRVYVNGKAATAVDTAIWVPAGLLFNFHVTDMVTTGLLGSGTVLAQQEGWSGQTLHLKFTLATP